MKSSIFLPEKIKVGYQERGGTYTGNLAYIIYFDEKGVLRKEKSWESWRDKQIEPQEFTNEPTSGFVLNKKAGGYSTGWNHRQTYVRVYDPRGFEFEITVPNLLYILENTSSIKGKGLEGEFVYGWDGKDLILIPTESPDYIELSKFNDIVHNSQKFKGKDLILGATYLTKDNHNYIYMGRFESYDSWRGTKERGKSYFFMSDSHAGSLVTLKSLTKLIAVVSEDCVDNFAELMDEVESNTIYSPYDSSKDEWVPYTLEHLIEKTEKLKEEEFFHRYRHYRQFRCFNSSRDGIKITLSTDEGREFTVEDEDAYYRSSRRDHRTRGEHFTRTYSTLEELFENETLFYKNCYLANGKYYKTEGK